jgi:2-iminoacetate synthase
MFSQKLESAVQDVENIGSLPIIDKEELRDLLAKSIDSKALEVDEILRLVNGTKSKRNREVVLNFASTYKRPHDDKILLLPPLYFASSCENNCLYCDFTSEGTTLSYEEFSDEIDALLAMGYRSIELVSSQDPDLYAHTDSYTTSHQTFTIDKVLRYFDIASQKLNKSGGGMLTSNIPPVDLKNFRKLKDTGLDCYLIWLETFNPAQYSRLHKQDGPKANQSFRIDSLETAIEAGIEHIAAAFLKGLYDWRKEEVILYLFDRHIKQKRGRGFSIIGSPRLKGSFLNSRHIVPYTVSDEEYELNIALDRILFDGILWLQTRESFEFNYELIERYGGGVILTLSSSTAPGGYSKPSKARAQFPVYKQKLNKSVSRLEKSGYEAIFDWDSQTLMKFLRNS